MKVTLDIYKDGQAVNHIEHTDGERVIREFAHCFATKINGVKTAVRKIPYSNKIRVTHVWPDVGGSAYKYVYVFEDVREEMGWR